MASLKKNMGYQLVFRILTVITPLVTSPWLSRALGAPTLGVYSATLAYINYFLLFSMLGVENYGNRTIAAVQDVKQECQRKFWNIYAIQAVATVIASLAYFGSIPFLAPQRKTLYLLQGIWLLSYGMDINWFFFGLEKFELTVKRSIVVKLLTVVAIVAFVHSPDDLPLYIVIMAGSNVISQSFLWVYVWRFIGFEKPKLLELKCHIRPMLELFVPVLASSVYHIMDKTMLDIFSDETALGYYYSADKVINIPLGVILAIGSVMLPRISNMINKAQNDSVILMNRHAVELTTFFSAAIGCGIAAIAKEFVPFFFGQGFEPCILLIYLFVPVLFVKACNNAIRAQYLIPAKKDKVYIFAVFAGAATNLVFNVVLIRLYDAAGAVIATLIAESVVLLIEEIAVRKEIPFGKFFIEDTIYLVFGFTMFIACRLSRMLMPDNNAVCVVCLIIIGAVFFLLQTFVYCLAKKDSIFSPIAKKAVSLVKKDNNINGKTGK